MTVFLIFQTRGGISDSQTTYGTCIWGEFIVIINPLHGGAASTKHPHRDFLSLERGELSKAWFQNPWSLELSDIVAMLQYYTFTAGLLFLGSLARND